MKSMIDRFNCVEDCPIFADMFDFCKMYAGASLGWKISVPMMLPRLKDTRVMALIVF